MIKKDSTIKAVIFDMDGVLIDSEPCYLNFELQWVRSKNPSVTIDQLYGTVGATGQDAWTIIANVIGNGQTWEELRSEFRSSVNVFSQMDYVSIYRKEATEVLKALNDHGYQTALASSTQPDIIHRVLRENGIESFFQVIASGRQFKKSKPDPEIYHFTAGALGLKEEECLVIEDSTLGITAAYRAGMTIAAMIDDRFCFDRSLADYEIHSLKEIPGLLGIEW